MRKLLITTVLVLGSVLPAAAQDPMEMDLDTAITVWRATQRWEREVWENNPNQGEMIRHKLLILAWEGFPLGFNPWDIDVSWNPPIETQEVVDCPWEWADDVGWYQACYVAGHMACAKAQDVFDLTTSLKLQANNARFLRNIVLGAAAVAGAIGQPWFVAYFTLTGLNIEMAALTIDRQIISVEGMKCHEP